MDIENTTEMQLPSVLPSSSLTMPQWLKLAYGVFFLYLSAQIMIPLPWTPVPISGQTFGVACVALSLGSLATPAVALYWLLGLCGFPVLAGAASGVSPASGYLLGMVLATEVMRRLKAKGFARTWWSNFSVLCAGQVIIFALGILVLSYFVPREKLLMAALWPFIPGDLLKVLAAATVSLHWTRYVDSKDSK
ncbi:MAG: biotin transporter BioY [Puniceicoccales bacterium]|nr:biotin transporter BioY [Puniceicoccales bacterium]